MIVSVVVMSKVVVTVASVVVVSAEVVSINKGRPGGVCMSGGRLSGGRHRTVRSGRVSGGRLRLVVSVVVL